MLTLVICLLLAFFTSAWGKTCDTRSLVHARQCSPTETCIPSRADINTGNCECLPGFNRLNDSFCINATLDNGVTPLSSSLTTHDDEQGGSVVAGILLPIFLITVVISGVYFGRRYNVIGYIRNKLIRRNTNYDEVMIGQDLDDDDDPPLR